MDNTPKHFRHRVSTLTTGFSSGLRPAADIFQRMHQMLGGITPKPFRILEADHIRKPLIPEKTDETVCFALDRYPR